MEDVRIEVSHKLKAAMDTAVDTAIHKRSDCVGTDHLLYGICVVHNNTVLSSRGVTPDYMWGNIRRWSGVRNGDIQFTKSSREVLAKAAVDAANFGSPIECQDALGAMCLVKNCCANRILESKGIECDLLYTAISAARQATRGDEWIRHAIETAIDGHVFQRQSLPVDDLPPDWMIKAAVQCAIDNQLDRELVNDATRFLLSNASRLSSGVVEYVSGLIEDDVSTGDPVHRRWVSVLSHLRSSRAVVGSQSGYAMHYERGVR